MEIKLKLTDGKLHISILFQNIPTLYHLELGKILKNSRLTISGL